MGKVQIKVDEKNSWRSNGDYKVGQFILILNSLNVKVE
jgi:hypothetical protein